MFGYTHHGNELLIVYSSVDIPIAEGPVNLNWGPIMKTINDSPYEFFRGGGWTFLGGTGDEVQSLLMSNPFFTPDSISFRANRKKRVRPNLSSKQNLCNPLSRRALVMLGVISMLPMLVTTKAAAPTLMMRAKVKCSPSCGIGYESYWETFRRGLG